MTLFIPKLSKLRRQNKVFVPQPGLKEQIKSCAFVPLSKGRRKRNFLYQSKKQRQTKVCVPQPAKEQIQTNTFPLQLSKGQTKTNLFVPQLSNERRKSKVFIPQLYITGMSQVMVYAQADRSEKLMLFPFSPSILLKVVGNEK